MQATPPGDQADQLDIILQEIRDSGQAIEKKLGSITIELNILKDDQKKLSDRLKQAESNVAEILPTHKENKKAVECLQQQDTYCNLGWTLLSADVNGDGLKDLVIGSPYAPGGGKQRGVVAAFYSSASRNNKGETCILT
ncbi:hypothetical protein NDU88_008078 [Pleurodeles waltl]|uniref:Uncharacterized protein n=1 Tax=Pleurodeles waltl TaxID=8319 RepID=A0AAV7VSL5_PLEWA|nr:hypothetical protein NDU88_008078 [Pleurodeles waltl]